jgi:DNA-binding IclR family transcriptional regulator
VLVGHLPEDERHALFSQTARASPTGRAGTDPVALSAVSARALADRLSVQISESDFSVCCIASPIRDAEGSCIATISIVLPENKALLDQNRYADAARAAAARIETLLGWR